jgi:hypothetical protein
MSSTVRVIVAGAIAQYPMGGMTWHYLQYVLGLARLGHDVFYVEDTGAGSYDPARGGVAKECDFSVNYLAGVMGRFGLADRWAYRFGPRAQWYGLADGRRSEVLRSADLLLNISGMLERPEDYRSVRRLAYVDTDPVFNQIKLLQGNERFVALVDAHDVHFTFGERTPGRLPPTGYRWRATRQPVVLSEWDVRGAPRRDVFTTVMNWSASKHPPVYDGMTYGQKDVEFLRFIDLPEHSAAELEIVINVGKRRRAPLDLIRSKGWRVVDAERACVDLDSYREYVQSSAAEWSVAKNGYVRGQPGWFSERSACYLAAGRPVVVQDTGLRGILPVGTGIVTFTCPEEAADAIRGVRADYAQHARAAREIAGEYVDSDKVLARLVEEATREIEPSRAGAPAARTAMAVELPDVRGNDA